MNEQGTNIPPQNAPAIDAIVLAFQGCEVPVTLGALFERHRLQWQSVEPQNLEAFSAPLIVLWVEDDWQKGLERLEELPENLRQSTLLTGSRKPGSKLIQAAMASGALAVAAHPVPAWFFPPLLAAATRRWHAFQRNLVEVIQELANEVADSPDSLLVTAAEVAGRVLNADLALATLKISEGSKFEVLCREAGGKIARQTWEDDPRRLRAPRGISRFVLEHQEKMIIPSASHSSLCEIGGGDEPFEAAVILPLYSPPAGIHGHRRPIVAAINLYWREPFLPTPRELLALEAISAFAISTLARLLEEARFSTIHSLARRALTVPSQVQPPPSSPESIQDLPADLLAVQDAKLDPVAHFIRLMIHAYSGRRGLREIWVKRPNPSLAEGVPQWLSLGGSSHRTEPPTRSRPVGDDLEVVELEDGSGRWAVQRRLRVGAPHLGDLVAVFDRSATAWAAGTEMHRLADDLYTALSLHRRSGDTKALLVLPTGSRLEDARMELARIAKTIRQRTGSDGVKLFVGRNDADGPKIVQLSNSDFPQEEPKALPFDSKKGLADWVFAHDDWLLIPRVLALGTTDNALDALTGKHGHQKVLARSEAEYWPAHGSPDREHSLLFVPLHSGAQVLGVQAVWREHPIPYQASLDLESLLYFAPYVASGCLRVLELTKAQEELTAITRLPQELAGAETLLQGYDAVTCEVGRLAQAACSLLLHFDLDQGSGNRHLVRSALWVAPGFDAEPITTALERFYLPCQIDSEQWPLDIIDGLDKIDLPLTLREVIVPSTPANTPPPLAVALFDAEAPSNRGVTFSDHLLEHYARSFLQSATAMLANQAANLASRLLDRIGNANYAEDHGAEDHGAAEGVLAHATELLRQAIGADAALIYAGTPRRMAVQSTWPPRPDLKNLRVREKSATQKSLQQGEPIRFLDLPSPEGELDPENLQRLAQAFGWPRVGSWLCCAVRHNDRSVGLIKVLTHHRSGFLGKDHEEVTRLIADRTAIEMNKASRREALHRLLDLSNELSTKVSIELEEQVAEKIRDWVEEMLHRPRCRVVVIAHNKHGKRLVSSATAQVSNKIRQDLETISLEFEHRQAKGKLKSQGSGNGGSEKTTFQLKKPRGLMVPITLAGEDRLKGHLFLIDQEPFSPDEKDVILDAAHHLALVLNGKRERMEWREVMGRFRHAILGPVTGAYENAMMLGVLSQTQGEDVAKKLETHRRHLEEEVRAIQLWRENSRFYLADRTELKLTKQALKDLIKRLEQRFCNSMLERGIHLKLEWTIDGELHLLFDREALDLALTNLLDNAQKYAYYNREVVLGVKLDRWHETLEIWVEDIGHPVSEELGQEIYRLGKREARFDPFRAILGQGLGLAMVLNIVKAHDGELGHTCEQMTPGEVTATTPFRVRFTMILPYRRFT